MTEADVSTGADTEAPKQNWLEALAPGRECGDCVACCFLCRIDEGSFQKPAGVMCRHCSPAGCGIHETRPNACRIFFCLWRRVAELPDELKPNKCGVMFSINYGPPGSNVLDAMFIRATAISDPAALDHPLVRGAIDMFAMQTTLAIHMGFEGKSYRVYPPDDLADAIVNPETTPYRHLLPQAMEWRKRRGIP